MIEDNALPLFSITILAIGIYAYARSSSVAERLRDFYSQYPIIRYAGLKQLTVKPIWVRLLGFIFVIFGLLCFFSLD